VQIADFAVAITVALTDPSGWTFAAAVLAGALLILVTPAVVGFTDHSIMALLAFSRASVPFDAYFRRREPWLT
jgi:hypothetical protein